MEYHWLIYILSLAIAGLSSGFAAGLFGVGGGIVRIPIFIFLWPFFGIDSEILMHLAAGTSLTLAIPSAIMASRAQHRAGNLDFNFLKTWVPGLVAGVFLGLLIMRYTSSRFLESVFAVVLILAAVHMLFLSDRYHLGNEAPKGYLKSISDCRGASAFPGEPGWGELPSGTALPLRHRGHRRVFAAP